MVLKTNGRVGSSSPSSIAVDISTKEATNTDPSVGSDWLSTAMAASKEELTTGVNDAKDELRAAYLQKDMVEAVEVEEVVEEEKEETEDEDDDDDEEEEEAEAEKEDEDEDEEDSRSVSGEPEDSEDYNERDGPPSDVLAVKDTTKAVGCGPAMTRACQMDFPSISRTDDKGPAREQKRGMEYLFELVESSLCGGCDTAKKDCNEIDSNHLPVYKLMPDLRKDSLTGDESSSSMPAYSYWTNKTSSSRRSSRGRTSSRRRGQTSSQRRRPNEDDAPNHRTRSSWTRPDRKEESKKKKESDRLAKTASAFIRENVDPTLTDVKVTKSFRSGLKPSSYLKQDKTSAFNATTSKTASYGSVATKESQITEMRELCVLNIGSGSSVSSYDVEGPSGSLHTRQEREKSPSCMSVLAVLTKNESNKCESTSSLMSQKEEAETSHKALRVLINFLYSLTNTMYGEGAAAPVNKTVCLLSLALIAVFWPEDREKYRVHVKKIEIPKPEKVSLLHLVTRGAS